MTRSAPDPGGPLLRPYEGVWPRIHADAWVAPGAAVVGDVEVGPDSSVWYCAVVRGDVHRVRIGARTNLQDHCVVHVTTGRFPCEIGDEVTVGHRATVHGCVVGDGALVGIGAIVLDGAHVAEGAWVGAGALVTPGTKVAAGSLVVGAPAREVRRVTEEERREQRERTLAYIETARRHAAAGAGAPGRGGDEGRRR